MMVTRCHHPLFAKEAFLSHRIFHVNPRIRHKERKNRGFGPFVAARGASPGFPQATPCHVKLLEQGKSEEEIKQTLVHGHGQHGEKLSSTDFRQVKVWQTQARVGDFVLMRHEHENCPLMPKRSLDEDKGGKYIGPVCALGVITSAPMLHQPGIEGSALQHIKGSMAEEEKAGLVTFAKVEHLRMGLKKDLLESIGVYEELLRSRMTSDGIISNLAE